MKALRIGNIISCCINGTFVFLGFIGYLVEGANDFASTFLVYGLFFLVSNYYIYWREIKGRSLKKFKIYTSVIGIITLFNIITGIIYLVVKSEGQLKENISNTEIKKAILQRQSSSYNNSINVPNLTRHKTTNQSSKSNNGFNYGMFYDENLLILDEYKNLKTPQYILIQLKKFVSDKQSESKMGFSIRFSGDIVEDSLKYKKAYVQKADYYPLKSYYTTFYNLNEHQLKWYLYWRKEFLSSNIIETDLSYIYLFSYELINYTFNDKASFNVSVIHRLNNSYKDIYPNLYLGEWLKDMFYELNAQHLISEEAEFKKSRLYEAIENNDTEYQKIGINIWRNHYSESNTNISNKKLKYLYQNSKFYSRFKKYASKTIIYYKQKNIDVLTLWFDKKSLRKRRALYSSAVVSFDRREANLEYFIDVPTERFNRDMSDITNLCYDFLVNNEFKYEDYIISLPKELVNTFERKKNTKNIETDEKNDLPVQNNIKGKIDITKIDTPVDDIVIRKEKSRVDITSEHNDFFKMFITGSAGKKEVKSFAISNRKLDKMLVAEINKKYYSAINQNIIEEKETEYVLSINFKDLRFEENS